MTIFKFLASQLKLESLIRYTHIDDEFRMFVTAIKNATTTHEEDIDRALTHIERLDVLGQHILESNHLTNKHCFLSDSDKMDIRSLLSNTLYSHILTDVKPTDNPRERLLILMEEFINVRRGFFKGTSIRGYQPLFKIIFHAKQDTTQWELKFLNQYLDHLLKKITEVDTNSVTLLFTAPERPHDKLSNVEQFTHEVDALNKLIGKNVPLYRQSQDTIEENSVPYIITEDTTRELSLYEKYQGECVIQFCSINPNGFISTVLAFETLIANDQMQRIEQKYPFYSQSTFEKELKDLFTHQTMRNITPLTEEYKPPSLGEIVNGALSMDDDTHAYAITRLFKLCLEGKTNECNDGIKYYYHYIQAASILLHSTVVLSTNMNTHYPMKFILIPSNATEPTQQSHYKPTLLNAESYLQLIEHAIYDNPSRAAQYRLEKPDVKQPREGLKALINICNVFLNSPQDPEIPAIIKDYVHSVYTSYKGYFSEDTYRTKTHNTLFLFSVLAAPMYPEVSSLINTTLTEYEPKLNKKKHKSDFLLKPSAQMTPYFKQNIHFRFPPPPENMTLLAYQNICDTKLKRLIASKQTTNVTKQRKEKAHQTVDTISRPPQSSIKDTPTKPILTLPDIPASQSIQREPLRPEYTLEEIKKELPKSLIDFIDLDSNKSICLHDTSETSVKTYFDELKDIDEREESDETKLQKFIRQHSSSQNPMYAHCASILKEQLFLKEYRTVTRNQWVLRFRNIKSNESIIKSSKKLSSLYLQAKESMKAITRSDSAKDIKAMYKHLNTIEQFITNYDAIKQTQDDTTTKQNRRYTEKKQSSPKQKEASLNTHKDTSLASKKLDSSALETQHSYSDEIKLTESKLEWGNDIKELAETVKENEESPFQTLLRLKPWDYKSGYSLF